MYAIRVMGPIPVKEHRHVWSGAAHEDSATAGPIGRNTTKRLGSNSSTILKLKQAGDEECRPARILSGSKKSQSAASRASPMRS
eukprot:scaffold387_cov31-Tisochrysis_lutea.AAC.4